MSAPIRVRIVMVHPQYGAFVRALVERTGALSADGFPFRVLTSPFVPEDTMYLLPGEEDEGEVHAEAAPLPTEIVFLERIV